MCTFLIILKIFVGTVTIRLICRCTTNCNKNIERVLREKNFILWRKKIVPRGTFIAVITEMWVYIWNLAGT